MGKRGRGFGRRQILQLEDDNSNDSLYKNRDTNGHGFGRSGVEKQGGSSSGFSGLVSYMGDSNDEDESDEGEMMPSSPPPPPQQAVSSIPPPAEEPEDAPTTSDAVPAEVPEEPRPASEMDEGESGPSSAVAKMAGAPGNTSMDTKLADFLAEIESMEVPPDSQSGSPVPDRQDVDGVPMSEEAAATPPSSTPPPPPPVESESEDTEYEEVEEQMEPLVEPTAPMTMWQHCMDDGTKCYYYWNTVTNEVTWEIPPDYSQYMLLLKEYEEAYAHYQAELSKRAAAPKKMIRVLKKKGKHRKNKSKETVEPAAAEEAPVDDGSQLYDPMSEVDPDEPRELCPQMPARGGARSDYHKFINFVASKEVLKPKEEAIIIPGKKKEVEVPVEPVVGPQLPPSGIEQTVEEPVLYGPMPQPAPPEDVTEVADAASQPVEPAPIGPQLPKKRDSSSSSSSSEEDSSNEKKKYKKRSRRKRRSSDSRSRSHSRSSSSSGSESEPDKKRKKSKSKVNANGVKKAGGDAGSDLDLDDIDRQLELALERKKAELEKLEAEEDDKKKDGDDKKKHKKKKKKDKKDEKKKSESDLKKSEEKSERKKKKKESKKRKALADELNYLPKRVKAQLDHSLPDLPALPIIKPKNDKPEKVERTEKKKKQKETVEVESKDDDPSKVKAEIEDLSATVVDKLEFLEISRKGLSKLQILFLQTETRLHDYREGGLDTAYMLYTLREASRHLQQYESSAAPPGWSCHWDRTYRRYFYFNTQTGETQWDYPDEPTARPVSPQPPAYPPPPAETTRKPPVHEETDPTCIMSSRSALSDMASGATAYTDHSVESHQSYSSILPDRQSTDYSHVSYASAPPPPPPPEDRLTQTFDPTAPPPPPPAAPTPVPRPPPNVASAPPPPPCSPPPPPPGTTPPSRSEDADMDLDGVEMEEETPPPSPAPVEMPPRVPSPVPEHIIKAEPVINRPIPASYPHIPLPGAPPASYSASPSATPGQSPPHPSSSSSEPHLPDKSSAHKDKDRKKKKDKKIAGGLALKKKNFPSLVEKWQQIQKDVDKDIKRHSKEQILMK